MTNQQRVAELEAKALPIPSRVDLFKSAVGFFKANPDTKFRLFFGIEFMEIDHVRRLEVAGTILEPVDNALKAAGVQTDGTIGNLLDVQALNDSDVHALACSCHVNAPSVDGDTASMMFQGRLQGRS